MNPSPDQLCQEAERAMGLGRAKRSLALLEEALSLDPERADLHYRVALGRLIMAQVTEGVEALERALELDPERALLAPEFLDPVDALLSRRPTFKNLVKLRKQLLAGKPLRLKDRVREREEKLALL